jgi:hypothetical protein
MGAPCPADPIWYREGCSMKVTCQGCGRSTIKKVRTWAVMGGLDSRVRLGQLVESLRCMGCGSKNPRVEVS